uniref:FRIGIDA-like protein n=1 Tax=Tanacetum cinerariifolium TaxID=118510 RepID=A0A6L2NRJ7_TANCI|nr:FRIGIDA-like protein 1 [Tanacetum cinerariifolium]
MTEFPGSMRNGYFSVSVYTQVHITQGDYDGKAVIIMWVTPDEPVKNYTFYNYKSGYPISVLSMNLSMIPSTIMRLEKVILLDHFGFKHHQKSIHMLLTNLELYASDLGKTYNSLSTLEHYIQSGAQVVLHVGYLLYADSLIVGNHEIEYEPYVLLESTLLQNHKERGLIRVVVHVPYEVTFQISIIHFRDILLPKKCGIILSGESDDNICELFTKAFIHKIDVIASKMKNLQRETDRRIVTQLLICIDEPHRATNDGNKKYDGLAATSDRANKLFMLKKAEAEVLSKYPTPGEYLASTLNGFDLQQYDGFAATSDRANKLLMLPHEATLGGLRDFIANNADDPLALLAQLPGAYAHAPDPASMVLEAVSDGFYSNGGKEVTELGLVRGACLVMLEGLVGFCVGDEVRDKAMEIANKWVRRCVLGSQEVREVNVLGFLFLVGVYGLVDTFGIDELIDCFVVVARRRQAVELSRRMVPSDKLNDLIQKLINKEMHVSAVKFSIELQKTDVFPPVRLLEEQKLKSMRAIEYTRHTSVNDPRICNEVLMKEINKLKSIIKCIDEHNLQSEYPKDSLVEHVNKLENEVQNSKQAIVKTSNGDPGFRKQPTIAHPCKKPKVNKTPPTDVSAVVRTVQDDIPIKESHSEEADVVPDHVNQYRSSPGGSSTMNPGPIASSCGFKVVNYGFVGNQMPADAGPGFYVAQPNPPSANNSNGWISD